MLVYCTIKNVIALYLVTLLRTFFYARLRKLLVYCGVLKAGKPNVLHIFKIYVRLIKLLVYCVLTAGKPLVTLTSHLGEPVSSDVTLLVCRLTPCPWSCLWYLSVSFPPSLHSRSPYTQHRRQWLYIHATSPPLPLNEITDLYFALAGRHSFDDILSVLSPQSFPVSVQYACVVVVAATAGVERLLPDM